MNAPANLSRIDVEVLNLITQLQGAQERDYRDNMHVTDVCALHNEIKAYDVAGLDPNVASLIAQLDKALEEPLAVDASIWRSRVWLLAWEGGRQLLAAGVGR